MVQSTCELVDQKQNNFFKNYKFKIGKGKIIKSGNDLSIIACGVMVERALQASKHLEKEGIKARVVNISTIKPIDKNLIIKCARETKNLSLQKIIINLVA